MQHRKWQRETQTARKPLAFVSVRSCDDVTASEIERKSGGPLISKSLHFWLSI